METALIGIGGIVVGAILAGGTQSVLSAVDRQRSARVAARVVWVSLFETSLSLGTSLKSGAWFESEFGWDRVEDDWKENRDALAAVVSAKEFALVALALTGVHQLIVTRYEHLTDVSPDGEKWDFEPCARMIEGYKPGILRALNILWMASYTRRERKKPPVKIDALDPWAKFDAFPDPPPED